MATYSNIKKIKVGNDVFQLYDSGNSGGTVTGITAGAGLSGGTISTSGTIAHSNSVTAQTTQAVYPIKIDAQGHISGYGSAVTSLPASDVYDWAKASTKPSYNFSEIGSKPTTISGYGITDAYTKTEVDGKVSGVLHYKGTKATVSDVTSLTGMATGDVWHVTANGAEYAYDGSTWQELGTAVDLSGYVPTSRTINSKALTGNISLTASDVGAVSKSPTTASLTTGGWSSNSQTISVSGVTASNDIVIAPAVASIDNYTAAGIKCTAQASGSLTFTCETTPSAAITVNVLILN